MRRWAVAVAGIVGLGAAGGGFYISEPSRLAAAIDFVDGGGTIAPGFVGMANFGRWRLICVRGPAPLRGLLAVTKETKTTETASNACRVNQEIRPPSAPADASSGDVLAAVNFSLLGAKRTPALMLRLPPTAEAGDMVRLRVDESDVVTTVRECGGGECLAASALTGPEWEKLTHATTLQIAFPAAGKQAVLLELSIEGLRKALAAMSRAQVAVPN